MNRTFAKEILQEGVLPENILGNVFFPLCEEKQKEGHEMCLFFNTDSVLEK